MSYDYPRPHRPNFRADRSGPANDGVTKGWSPKGVPYGFTYSGYSDVSVGFRSYGSGYPLRSLGAGRFFRRCADYAILGHAHHYKYGEAVFRYEQSWYGHTNVSRIITGPSERNFPHIGADDSPYFHNEDFVWMPANTYNRLCTEVMLKVGSKKASFGESIAESREALQMLTKSAVSLYQAYRAARRGNWSGVAKALKVRRKDFTKRHTVSERWLEYQYGWKPLMNDIYDAHELIQKGFREKTQWACSVRNLKDSHTHRVDYGGGSTDETVSSAKFSMKVFYSVSDSTLSKLGQMGLINPLSVAWEVVPFSFVVDWFLPVGNFLEAITAPLGVTFIDGYASARCESTKTSYRPESPYADEVRVSDTRGACCSMSGFTRRKLDAFPAPALYFKSPFSEAHALNALALISQLTKR